MATITVKQFVMLLTSQSIVATARMMPLDIEFSISPYLCSPIARIYCTDGTSISVQAHAGAYCRFSDVNYEGPFSWHASSFGKDLIMAETDSADLNPYGIDKIEDIEKYVESHGGIDIESTTSHAIEDALKSLEPYKIKGL